MDTKNVGVIGLGLMGTALTERLLQAGYTVWVYNRTREKAQPLLALGAHWADNPLTVCDRVLISLYTTDTVEEVLERLSEGLRGADPDRHDDGRTGADGAPGRPTGHSGRALSGCAHFGFQRADAARRGDRDRRRFARGV